MAARSRPRQATKDDTGDAHEERNMWLSMVAEIKKLHGLNVRANEVMVEINRDEEMFMEECGGNPTVEQIDTLQSRYREGLKLAEEELKCLHDDPNGILQSLNLLVALRSHSEAQAAASVIVDKKSRNNPKRKLDDMNLDSPIVTSPAPLSAGSRTKISAVTAKEIPRAEESPTEKSSSWLTVGNEVAYKPRAKSTESDWIQCEIKSISGDGMKMKFVIQDIDPDESGGRSQYTVKQKDIIPIPPAEAVRDLPELGKGKHVLARYPETTVFYKAEVTGTKKDGTICRLKFEGEEEANKEMEVERRYVLDQGGK